MKVLAAAGCCESPLHVAPLPPFVEAAITVLVIILVAYLMHIGWKWMSSPFARHACGLCSGRGACGFCEREERDRQVARYAEQARERRASRNA